MWLQMYVCAWLADQEYMKMTKCLCLVRLNEIAMTCQERRLMICIIVDVDEFKSGEWSGM
jgi:hypothetical protein